MKKVSRLLDAFCQIILGDKIAKRFLIAVTLSVSFSIAIILSTVGLMDGFQDTLSDALRKSLGDIVLVHRDGLFELNDEMNDLLRESNLEAYSSAYQVEGFIITGQGERGVQVLGIRPESYSQVTGQEIFLEKQEAAIGYALSQKFSLKLGDEINLAFVNSNSKGDVLPSIYSFIVSKIVKHEVFEKDSRTVYVDRSYLDELGMSHKDNLIFGLFSKNALSKNELLIKEWELRKTIGSIFKTRLYGGEYQSLMHAVEVEKVSISIILQVIVLVAVFNIAAFIVFISEKKSKDFFLLRALGVPFKRIAFYWGVFITALWGSACLIAIVFTFFFDILLRYLPWFKLPGKIYVLSSLKINLSINEYMIVFLAAAIWIFLVALWALWKMSKKKLLSGLREEFA